MFKSQMHTCTMLNYEHVSATQTRRRHLHRAERGRHRGTPILCMYMCAVVGVIVAECVAICVARLHDVNVLWYH